MNSTIIENDYITCQLQSQDTLVYTIANFKESIEPISIVDITFYI